MAVLAVVLSLVSLHGAPFKATLTAATSTPKVNSRWAYTVKVMDATGKPIAAKITVRIKDPLGGIHPVEFYNRKQNVVAYPIKGIWRDAATWPPSARGFALTFQVIVATRAGKKTLSYVVTPK